MLYLVRTRFQRQGNFFVNANTYKRQRPNFTEYLGEQDFKEDSTNHNALERSAFGNSYHPNVQSDVDYYIHPTNEEPQRTIQQLHNKIRTRTRNKRSMNIHQLQTDGDMFKNPRKTQILKHRNSSVVCNSEEKNEFETFNIWLEDRCVGLPIHEYEEHKRRLNEIQNFHGDLVYPDYQREIQEIRRLEHVFQEHQRKIRKLERTIDYRQRSRTKIPNPYEQKSNSTEIINDQQFSYYEFNRESSFDPFQTSRGQRHHQQRLHHQESQRHHQESQRHHRDSQRQHQESQRLHQTSLMRMRPIGYNRQLYKS
eukprot:UN32902